jgi:YegS/Rv2252/BmrU family lipid kinase
MAIAVVLASMLVRRRGLRRLLIGVSVAVALVVGADRVLLGVHNVSDVVGGFLLGIAIALFALVGFDPQPRSISLVMDPLPEAIPSSDRHVAAILNPVKVDDPAGFRQMVERMAIDSGWGQVSWWETTVEDTGYQMAHEAAVSGADLVIAIGGDGTIRAVCEELAGTGVPVGIVPAGTGNLLARNLSIPLYLRAAVDVGLNGQDRAIDMVRVSGDEMEDATFLVMAGMGFDAAIMEGVNEDFKAKVGWLAYVWSALKALMFPVIRVEISVDDGPFTRHRARTLVIGNVGHLQAGMPLIPDAAIDDGQLDVVLLYPRRFLSWLPLAARVLTKNKRTDETITRMTGRSVVVRSQAPAPRQLDGDLVAPGKELRAECVHGRLLVRVPR